MRKAIKKDNERYQPPTPPRWKGRESLDLALEINQRVLKLMSDWAAHPDTVAWPLTTQDRKLWSALDSRAIASAARFPFVILDVHFTDVEWWWGMIAGSPKSAASDTWPANMSDIAATIPPMVAHYAVPPCGSGPAVLRCLSMSNGGTVK